MNDPMDDLLKLTLAPTDVPQQETDQTQKASNHELSPDEKTRLTQLNTSILSEIKEKEKMGKYGTYCKRSAQAAAIIAAIVLAFGSVTAIAAYRFLNPAQVATETNNKKLSEAFQGNDALFVNKTQTFGDYAVTLLGSTAGKNISDIIPADIVRDEIYAILALKRTDGTPMPKSGAPDYAKLTFFPSFYIKGLDPFLYNLDGMNGYYTSCVKNGVHYYIVAMSNIEMFADKGIYVGLCSAGEEGDYNRDAYTFHKKTGKITRNQKFSGVNALFALPVDKSKANPKKAEKFIYDLNHPKSAQPSALTEKEKQRERANKEITRLASEFLKTVTPENINNLCELDDFQTCVPDKDGVFTYSFRIGDSDTGYHTEKTDDCFKDKTPGVLNISDGFGLGGGTDHYYKIESMTFTTYMMNEDGTVTRSTYRPNSKSVKKIKAKCKVNLKQNDDALKEH